MKSGNWIPIDKRLAYYLPLNRPYTELEAMFSYTKDVDESKEKSTREYARIWQWSRTKVDNFLTKIKASREPAESHKKASKEPDFRLIYNNLQTQESQQRASKEPEESQKRATTINPNPKPNPKPKKQNHNLEDLFPICRAWNSYLEMRTTIKKPLTNGAKGLAVKRLLSLNDSGHDPVEVLNQSTLNSWQGLFEIKENKAAGRSVSTHDQQRAQRLAENAEACRQFAGDFSYKSEAAQIIDRNKQAAFESVERARLRGET